MHDDCDFAERAGIMQFCGKWSKREAERLARERPWEKEPWWGLPRPEQLGLEGVDDKKGLSHA